ncbi:MAG: universal stress protein [Chitinophagaceae bacterium]
MSILLSNILVPVDFSVNTEVAIKKAIEMVKAPGAVIHLLHVSSPQHTWNYILSRNGHSSMDKEIYYSEAMRKLKEWKIAIELTIPQTTIKICMLEGTVHAKIIQVAVQIKAQLIIIAKKRSPDFFGISASVHPNRLAKSSTCPVLTIRRGSMQNKIKTIVVPVRSFIPYRKIELAIEFAKRDRAKIHVVTLQSKMATWNIERNYLLETYRLLKSRLTNAVEYHVLNGTNLPKATLDYAQHIGADLILANPCSETKITVFTGKHMNDLLLASSKLQILSVEPYPYRQQKSDENSVSIENTKQINVV